jgi:hypothetical protein
MFFSADEATLFLYFLYLGVSQAVIVFVNPPPWDKGVSKSSGKNSTPDLHNPRLLARRVLPPHPGISAFWAQ